MSDHSNSSRPAIGANYLDSLFNPQEVLEKVGNKFDDSTIQDALFSEELPIESPIQNNDDQVSPVGKKTKDDFNRIRRYFHRKRLRLQPNKLHRKNFERNIQEQNIQDLPSNLYDLLHLPSETLLEQAWIKAGRDYYKRQEIVQCISGTYLYRQLQKGIQSKDSLNDVQEVCKGIPKAYPGNIWKRLRLGKSAIPMNIAMLLIKKFDERKKMEGEPENNNTLLTLTP